VRFLCDENVDRQVVDALRQAGHTVTYIAELSPSVDDERVLADANRESALLVTSDRDFGALVFNQGKVSSGVLLIRLAGLTPAKRAEIIVAALRDHGAEMAGVFTVISPGMIRYRRTP